MPLDTKTLLRYFDPQKFVVKMTPLNPTYRAARHDLVSYLGLSGSDDSPVVRELEDAGYQVIVSIGEPEENLIGSNCGQYVLRHLQFDGSLPGAYTYGLESLQADHLV